MLIVPQLIEMKWNKNPEYRQWYIKKGYNFTKVHDIFYASVIHLPIKSKKRIKFKCDYCGETNETSYANYNTIREKSLIKKDCCRKCHTLKSKESNLIVYGTESVLQLELVRKHTRESAIVKPEIVKSAFENKGYQIINFNYKDNKTKIKYICPLHKVKGIQEITYNKIQKGQGCKWCGIESYTGENHHNWKGGLSRIRDFLRDRLSDWKRQSAFNCNFRCVLTNDKFDDIHHLYSFNLILNEVFEITNLPVYQEIGDYTEEELTLLKETCLQLHEKYPLGVCLRRDLHILFHKLFNKGYNTPEQFEEFKTKYINGELDHLLNKKEVI